MYLTRLQLTNYGPLRDLDIRFPFDDARPKPVLLVGENGSGKTIVLSHIVNAMLMAKDTAYQDSSEVDVGKVFKLRSGFYVSVGAEYYYARCDFQSGHFVRELRLTKPKHEYTEPPMGVDGLGSDAWTGKFDSDEMDHIETNILERSQAALIKEMVSANCLLYFPSNRAEEPAWLNQENLRAKPHYKQGVHRKGETRRRLIAHSPLRDIHDWLYDVAYDRAAFEVQSPSFSILASTPGSTRSRNLNLPVFMGYSGDATNVYQLARNILQMIIRELAIEKNLRFGIGGRHNRIITLESDQQTVVPNLFQLSSGEMALLALFLSILRDYDLREARNVSFAATKDVKGIVVIDEIDLHLHSRHQHDILPSLVHMFPQIQFVMTTHSPLVVLGMAKVFGEDDFEVYDLPNGSRIAPEDFDEFGQAFQAFKVTTEFSKAIRAQVEKAQRPILFVEGKTDRDYLRRAAELLGKNDVLEKFEVQAAGGNGRLKTIWTNLEKLAGIPGLSEKTVVLLHDPESPLDDDDKGNIHKRKIPRVGEHPINKGVENLFGKATLERAQQQHPRFIDIASSHTKTVRGKEECVPESWSVNDDEKRNLCDWLRSHGTVEDFRHFGEVIRILEQIVCPADSSLTNAPSEAKPS